MTSPEAPSISTKNGATGHVVVVPGRARHHGRDVGRREAADARDALLPGVLAHAHEAGVAGDLDRPAVAEHVPEREARAAPAREEREQGEVLGAHDRDAHRVVLGGGADDVDRAARRPLRHLGGAHDRRADRAW